MYQYAEKFLKGKTIIELYRTVERKPFFERKKKLFDSRERNWLLLPQCDEITLWPCNVPIQIVKAAKYAIQTQEEFELLRKLVRASIGNLYTHKKGVPVFTEDEYERVRTSHQLITDELIDSIIYCVWRCEEMLPISHNLTWLFYGTTSTGDYYVDAKELYTELPRITIE